VLRARCVRLRARCVRLRAQAAPARLPLSSAWAVWRSGIVQGKALVQAFDQKADFATLRVAFPAGCTAGIAIGASVAINGTCLTVTQQQADDLCFDLIVETLRATNLGTLRVGSEVNFERSARIGDEVGGHNVSGHVHTTAVVKLVEDTPDNRKVVFTVPQQLMKYILPKVRLPAPARAALAPLPAWRMA
jgi:riboflavin synthase